MFGPCEDVGCGHRDCKATRAMAESICRLCEQPIGYDVRFYHDNKNEGQWVHAFCLETRAETLGR